MLACRSKLFKPPRYSQYTNSWGHPEGYLEAFANLYRNFALTIVAKENGVAPAPAWIDFPGTVEGLRGMAFVETMIRSNKTQGWIDFIQ